MDDSMDPIAAAVRRVEADIEALAAQVAEFDRKLAELRDPFEFDNPEEIRAALARMEQRIADG